MSGPKCSSYEDRAAQAERELRAALQLWRSQVAEVAAFNAETSADFERFGDYGLAATSVPLSTTPAGDASFVAQQTFLLSDALEQARTVHSLQVAQSSARKLADAIATYVPSPEQLTERIGIGSTLATFDGDVWQDRLERAVADVPIDCDEDIRHSIAETAATALDQLERKGDPAKITSLIDATVGLVNRAQRQAAQRQLARSNARRLLNTLLGTAGDEKTDLLAERIRAADDPAQMESLVTRDIERRRVLHEAADRQRVLSAAVAALSDAGYSLGVEFATAAQPDSLAMTSSNDHGLRVREREGQLFFNVVRVDSAGRTAPDRDASVEREWCTDFAAVRARLATQGFELDLRSALEPGERLVDVMTPGEVANAFGASVAERFTHSSGSSAATIGEERQRRRS